MRLLDRREQDALALITADFHTHHDRPFTPKERDHAVTLARSLARQSRVDPEDRTFGVTTIGLSEEDMEDLAPGGTYEWFLKRHGRAPEPRELESIHLVEEHLTETDLRPPAQLADFLQLPPEDLEKVLAHLQKEPGRNGSRQPAPKIQRLRFLRGVTYGGQNYGPEQPGGDLADVDLEWAEQFLRSGHAVRFIETVPWAEQ